MEAGNIRCEIKECEQHTALTYSDKGIDHPICYEHWTDICNEIIKPENDVWKE